MRLEKREVTLNEADSLKDMYYMEKTLANAYADGAKNAQRKESSSLLASLLKETQSDGEFLKERLKKSLAKFSKIDGNNA